MRLKATPWFEDPRLRIFGWGMGFGVSSSRKEGRIGNAVVRKARFVQ